MTFEIYERPRVKKGGKIFWRIKDKNTVVAESVKGSNKDDCIKTVMKLVNHPETPAVHDLTILKK